MEFILNKGEAKGIVVLKEQIITVSCIGGGQLADLVFLDYHQGITLDRLSRLVLRCGDELFNSNEEAVLRVTSINSTADTNILIRDAEEICMPKDLEKIKLDVGTS